MNSFVSLLLLYVKASNPLRLSAFALKTPREKLKTAVFVCAFLYVTVFFTLLFFQTAATLYALCPANGQTHPVPFFAVCLALLVSYFSAFYAVTASFTNTRAQELLTSFPIQKKILFYARFVLVYAETLPFCALIMAVGCGTYAYFEGLSASFCFYATLVTGILTLPLMPISVLFALITPALGGKNAVKRQRAISTVGTILMIVFVSALTVFFQRIGYSQMEPKTATHNLAAIFAAFNLVSRFLTPISLLLFVLVSAAVVTVTFITLPKPYARALSALGETTRSEKTSVWQQKTENAIPSRSLFALFVRRDIAAVFTEPAFLTAGPLTVVLLPVLAVLMFSANPAALQDLLLIFELQRNPHLARIVAIAFAGAFASATSNIGATAFSREGNFLSIVAALPVAPKIILNAKYAHTMLYSLLCAVFSGVIILFSAQQPFLTGLIDAALTAFSCFAISCFLHLCALYIDARRPHISWQRPFEAMKRNLNTVISFFVQSFFFILFFILSMLYISTPLQLGTSACMLLLVCYLCWKRFERSTATRFFQRMFL